MNYIIDGCVHEMEQEGWYYAAEYAKAEEVWLARERLIKEYAMFLIKNYPEEALEIMMKTLAFSQPESFSFVYRPPEYVSVLAQRGTVGIKFKV